jgi:hypothetical protein
MDIDLLAKIALIIIGTSNFFLAFFIFRKNYSWNDQIKKKERNLALIKTLVIDQGIKDVYLNFEVLMKELNKIPNEGMSFSQRVELIPSLEDVIFNFRKNFIDLFAEINQGTYLELINITDDYQSSVMSVLSDEGINLNHKRTYDENILGNIIKFKSKFVSVIYKMD